MKRLSKSNGQQMACGLTGARGQESPGRPLSLKAVLILYQSLTGQDRIGGESPIQTREYGSIPLHLSVISMRLR